MEHANETEEEYIHSQEKRADTYAGETEEKLTVFPVKKIAEKMNRYFGIAFTMLESKCGPFKVRASFSFQAKGVNPYNNSFELLTRDLKRLKRAGYRVVLLSGSHIMPCLAKKYEAARPEFSRGDNYDTDYVISTREFIYFVPDSVFWCKVTGLL